MSSVKNFGAIGDGVHDDSPAIQHCLEQGDGELLFPRGTYRLTRPIEVDLQRHGCTSVSGSGGVAKLLMTAAGPALHVVGTHGRSAAPEDFRPVVWERERMPTVGHLEIEGAHAEADGIRLEGVMQPTLEGLLIRRCRYGVHLVKRNRNVLLANSHIYHGRDAAIGVYFDGVNLHQTNIVGCHISYHRHAGIKVERSEIRNLQITGCDIEYNFDPDRPDSADVWIDARAGTVREGTIASNTIQAKRSPGGANLRLEGLATEHSQTAGLWTIASNILQSQTVNLLLRSCRGVVVSGNSFASGYERSIVVEKCRQVAIGVNTFDYNPDYGGDRIDGITLRDSSGCSLSGLVLEGTRAGRAESGGAIEVFQSRQIAISNCQVLDPVERGIYLEDVTHSRVSDCTVMDRRVPATMRAAIVLRGAGRDNLIGNNLVGPGREGALMIAAGTASVQGNVVVG